MGKEVLRAEKKEPNEKEIAAFIKTLAPKKTEKGVRVCRDKTGLR